MAKRVIFLVINKPLVSGTRSWRQRSIALRCQTWWWPTSQWCPNTEGRAETDSFSQLWTVCVGFHGVLFSSTCLTMIFQAWTWPVFYAVLPHSETPCELFFIFFSFPNAISNTIKWLSSSLCNTVSPFCLLLCFKTKFWFASGVLLCFETQLQLKYFLIKMITSSLHLQLIPYRACVLRVLLFASSKQICGISSGTAVMAFQEHLCQVSYPHTPQS